VITQTLAVPATPHRAWQAWAESDRIVEWFSGRASGGALPGDEVTWEFNGFDHPMRARVERSHPGRELIYSLDSGPTPGLLEIRFDSLGAETAVHVTQSGLPETGEFDELARGVESGWANALEYLKLYLAQYQGRRKFTSIAMAPINSECDAAMQWFEPGLKRERWLDVPAAQLQTGWRLPRHFVWLWPAIEGTLEMSVFQPPTQSPVVCLRAVSWLAAPVAGLDNRLAACVQRLSTLLS
jgi:uncharacterized protein YndB with AHSA1/START domain